MKPTSSHIMECDLGILDYQCVAISYTTDQDATTGKNIYEITAVMFLGQDFLDYISDRDSERLLRKLSEELDNTSLPDREIFKIKL